MSVVDDYLETLTGKEKQVLRHAYDVARNVIPNVQAELKYNMPTLTYKGKGVVSIIANKNFLSYYPFCNHETLGVDVSGYETTKGSIHFTVQQPLPDQLIQGLVKARVEQIEHSLNS